MKDQKLFFELIDQWANIKLNSPDRKKYNRIYYDEKYIKKLTNIFKKIDRADFVPAAYLYAAYSNNALPTYSGQTISQPEIVFDMTYYLEIDESHKILEIGTGVGYQTAILATIGKEIYTIERIEKLSLIARENLSNYNFTNIKFFTGDGSIGLIKHAPFDRIIVTAAAPSIPLSLKKQLKEDGIMIIPVGEGIFSQTLIKYSLKYGSERIYACAFVKLIGKEGFPFDYS